MMRALHILFWLAVSGWLSGATAHAQTPGSCPRSQGEAYLDVNNVRARILNNGALFYRGSPWSYEVPQGSGIHAVFASSIWVGGLSGGQIRTAATRYGEWEFWPGPLDDDGTPPADCTLYDRLWEITRQDFETYYETGAPTANLRDWPRRLGAPVLDGDGIDGNYNLDGGDRPALLGDQMLWWIMNDRGNVHESTGSPPIGLEVHGSAFAFLHPSSYIGTTTFYRFKLVNKNTAPLEAAYFGLYVDADLGHYDDDYIGSDTLLHLGFTYNADNDDEGDFGYGRNPPALGYTFLRTAAQADSRDNNHDGRIDEPGEQQGMTSFMFFFGGGCEICDPLTARDYYYYMQARWKNGTPVTLGGNGRDFSNTPTPYFYPGDPITDAFWSERNLFGTAYPETHANDPSDRIFLLFTGPFTLQPGASQDILFAIVWSRGADHLDSVRRLKKDVQRLHEVADAILVPDVTRRTPAPEPDPDPVLGFAQNYPNPFTSATTIRYSLPQPMYVRLKIYDLLGRAVATLVDEHQAGGIYEAPFEAGDLPGGIYFYRIEMDHLRFTKKMILSR